ncbi:MAG TPA: hypothetical protein VKB75_08935 [Jatrophihabitans sp.]|nr:hypothetical protein [Jatrophihabitans sp.]
MAQEAGRGRHHAPDPSQDQLAWGSGDLIRRAILLIGLALGVIGAVWRWAVATPLLGAHLPTAAHVVLVAVFLAAVLLVSLFGSQWAYRRLARWSQARRAREREHYDVA